MEENEFIPVNQDKKGPSKKKKSASTSSKKGKGKKDGSFMSKIDTKKIATVFGSFFIVFSFFLAIACFSYLLTWQLDQDKLIDVSFIDFIFGGKQVEIHNWLGKFGAWMSHYLIYDLFGVASFGICFLMFLSGYKVLYKKALLPLGKTFTITILYMLWSSVFLAYLSDKVDFVGGSFGFYVNTWLIQTLGEIGTITLTLVLLYIITTLLFNPDYTALYNYLFPKKDVENEEEESSSSDDNMHIINPIKEDEIQEDVISTLVNFTEEDEPT